MADEVLEYELPNCHMEAVDEWNERFRDVLAAKLYSFVQRNNERREFAKLASLSLIGALKYFHGLIVGNFSNATLAGDGLLPFHATNPRMWKDVHQGGVL